MQRHLRTHDVAEWARSFLQELGVDDSKAGSQE
jgi:trehalose 6-phosphate synthase